MPNDEVDVGIDPGKTGALAAIGETVALADMMPIIPGKSKGTKTAIDISGVASWFRKIQESYVIRSVCIEKQQPFPAQGGVSNFTIGDTYGILRAVTITLGLPLMLVRPQAWKKVVLAGTQKDKPAAIQFTLNRYPSVDINIGKTKIIYSDGMADAICIADYARRSANGKI